jgi:methylated-DNA-[protein]-cysteine S-methyltransferase
MMTNPDSRMYYTRLASPLGWIFLAATVQGLCVVQFSGPERPTEADAHTHLQAAARGADLRPDGTLLRHFTKALRAYFAHRTPLPTIPLDLSRGSAFQQRVWEALCDIPFGETRTYGDIARSIGQPRAARAVGQACSLNPVAIVVPCHRVIAQNGTLGGYAGGVHIKQFLLAHEEQALMGPA